MVKMAEQRTGRGDPARTLALLWRGDHGAGASEGGRRRRGPRQRLSVDAVVNAAISLADAEGLEPTTMRAVAERLSVSPMTLYTYVPGKSELLDLMLDAVYEAMPRPSYGRAGWRTRLRRVADANRALFAEHPWAARVSTARPPLGPGTLAKYEHELAAFEGIGLSDLEIDSALTHLLAFVQSWSVAEQAASRPAREGDDDDAQWWRQAGPLLAKLVDPAEYPLATRVGSAAGAEQGAAYDPERAYSFGLARVLDGFGVLIGAGGD